LEGRHQQPALRRDQEPLGPAREASAGGSSGGAGAAVAAGLAPLALGTDGAGSIRIPASFCGIVGLKQQLWRVPTYPASPVETVAHTGPMARTVRDAALLLNVIAGPDERDRLSLPASARLAARLRGGRARSARRLVARPRLRGGRSRGRPDRRDRRAPLRRQSGLHG
jgi:Asp-tRNA(Asn)/Glu-tRNA(Gln) amidotransferase A subunit family amidase